LSRAKILVADDEETIRDVMNMILSKEGYTVVTAVNGEDAFNKFKEDNDFDLVILDIIMPLLDGIQTAKEIRQISVCPILFLTAKSTDNDKIAAYGSGGDDYLQKPFSRVELLLRVNVLIKRCSAHSLNEVVLLKNEKSIVFNNRKIKFTNKEYTLFEFFYMHKGEAFDIQQLYENVWQEKYMESSANTVMVYILNIRKKIEEDYTHPKIILTIWGKGYCYAQE
jgi:DNA-binding response OmpR family regulator